MRIPAIWVQLKHLFFIFFYPVPICILRFHLHKSSEIIKMKTHGHTKYPEIIANSQPFNLFTSMMIWYSSYCKLGQNLSWSSISILIPLWFPKFFKNQVCLNISYKSFLKGWFNPHTIPKTAPWENCEIAHVKKRNI